MKKTLTITAISIIASAAFLGCKKSSSSPTYNLSATINGKSYSSAAVADKNGTILSIFSYPSATSITYPFVEIVLSSYASTGTYSIDGMTNVVSIDSSSTQATTCAYGSVIVTGTSPLTGTFTATMVDSTKVTNGTFSVKAP